jgi:Domain of unknown function (DUF4384)
LEQSLAVSFSTWGDRVLGENMRSGICMAAIGLVFALAHPAMAEDDAMMRIITVEQVTAFNAGTPKLSDLQIDASVDRPDRTYARGEVLKLSIKTNQDAFVTIFNVGPTGKVTQLFPNKFQKDSLIKADVDTLVPSEESTAQIKIAGNLGAELIKIVATNKPTDLGVKVVANSDQTFSALNGGVQELVRDLEVTTNPAAPAADKIAILNLTIKTVGSR